MGTEEIDFAKEVTVCRECGVAIRATLANIVIDPVDWAVLVDGAPVPLTRIEYLIMREFAYSGEGKPLGRDYLRRAVWGGKCFGERTVDIHISRLRRKLLNAGASVKILSNRGLGYQMVRKAPSR